MLTGKDTHAAKEHYVPAFCYNYHAKDSAVYAAAEAQKMISLTPTASSKVKEIMGMQNPVPTALRVAVVGGGCSGFQYHMAFENQTNDSDEVVDFNGLKVAVDQMSSMYLEGVEIDYIETVEGAGFKFNNPNVKSTCGCGSSFSV
ncbi:MAG TPA: iron-sulfur cluster insertion protein ErpA [Candidatus Acidoferrum sp.]|jgi:iron-sulfur cluster assembly protein